MTPNLERIAVVKSAILARNDLIMDSFFEERSRRYDGYAVMRTGKIETPCGTACCIAGEALLCFPAEFKAEYAAMFSEGEAFRHSSNPLIARVASEVLGLSTHTFFAHEWPYEIAGLSCLEDSFDDTYNPGDRIQLAIKAIDFFTLNPDFIPDELPETPETEDDFYEEEEEEEEEEEDA